MRLTFIGGGTMGEAMVRCVLAKDVAVPQDIIVSDVDRSRRELLAREYGVGTSADSRKAIDGADLIILAVKPQDLPRAMERVRSPSPEQVVLSIAAGASLSTLRHDLSHSYIIRAMPNMPARIGEGMTVWTASGEVGQRQKEMARSVLGALGEEVYVPDEKYLDMATALSGSGPAYVFLFIEVLIEAGVHIGLPRSLSEKLVIQTVLGSTLTAKNANKHPAELKNMVTTPGGTTTEALLQLEKGNFRSLLLEAVGAAYDKAKQS